MAIERGGSPRMGVERRVPTVAIESGEAPSMGVETEVPIVAIESMGVETEVPTVAIDCRISSRMGVVRRFPMVAIDSGVSSRMGVERRVPKMATGCEIGVDPPPYDRTAEGHDVPATAMQTWSARGGLSVTDNLGYLAPTTEAADQVSLNPDLDGEWLEIVTRNLNEHNKSGSRLKPGCSIYEVPPEISQVDPEAYKPKVVSIGPFHCWDTSDLIPDDPYHDTQRLKWRCLGSFLSRRVGAPDSVDLLTRCIAKMMGHQERILGYYSKHDVKAMKSEELAMIMVLDGCFILQILLDPDRFQLLPHNQVGGRLWIWTLVRYDLLLLENQIPFFVLYELLDILGIGDQKHANLVNNALRYFEDAELPGTKSFSPPERDGILHLLHLFYMSRLPIHLSDPPSAAQIWIPRATELTDFGVKFDKDDKAKSFLDVDFTQKGVMKIPPLLVDDHTKDLFRNLIAFEQCYPFTGCHISVYTSFMDCIVNSEQDVRLLHLNGILTNRMSADQDITRFFSSLCRGVHVARDRFYLANLFADVTEYKDNKFNRCQADFKRTYCSNTWAVFAAVVSVVFFVLTVVQTFFTIFPYYNPRN